ncbi:MAG: 2-amino-4-hydroxy-6-hydroxymethyldihydropteridine diphosphokinase [Armatimonadetes bacterium]|nr:2-amino-4-hydroxy-6-hydroxymethyldihydropteridine diphosphokinase [Armatimonadota bacterium]
MMKTVYLGLGANIGDCKGNLREAVRQIVANSSCEVTAISGLYETKPVGFEDQPDFLNAVIEVKTTLSPCDLLGLCNKVEENLGRKRTIPWGPRVIDIDVLLYEGVESSDESLTIPHPRMRQRAFVLAPLADIAPNMELAGGITASEAAQRIGQMGIKKIADETWSQR